MKSDEKLKRFLVLLVMDTKNMFLITDVGNYVVEFSVKDAAGWTMVIIRIFTVSVADEGNPI